MFVTSGFYLVFKQGSGASFLARGCSSFFAGYYMKVFLEGNKIGVSINNVITRLYQGSVDQFETTMIPVVTFENDYVEPPLDKDHMRGTFVVWH